VPGLAKVLDDEPILVVDHVTGRGFRLTMSGVGDNFQRHTLIADRLVGDPARGLVGGEPPAPAWSPQPPPRHPSARPTTPSSAGSGYSTAPAPASAPKAARPTSRPSTASA
jgi:hypothetical protein